MAWQEAEAELAQAPEYVQATEILAAVPLNA